MTASVSWFADGRGGGRGRWRVDRDMLAAHRELQEAYSACHPLGALLDLMRLAGKRASAWPDEDPSLRPMRALFLTRTDALPADGLMGAEGALGDVMELPSRVAVSELDENGLTEVGGALAQTDAALAVGHAATVAVIAELTRLPTGVAEATDADGWCVRVCGGAADRDAGLLDAAPVCDGISFGGAVGTAFDDEGWPLRWTWTALPSLVAGYSLPGVLRRVLVANAETTLS